MKINHILNTKDFDDVLKNGRQLQGKTVSMYIKEEGGTGALSVGVIASKRCAHKAIIRNYIKRLIYAYFHNQKLPRRKNIKVIIKLNRDVKETPRKALAEEITEDLRLLTKKAGGIL